MKINTENAVISISEGNMKTGAIPAFSLAPGRSCSATACKTCLKEGCYAMKSYRMYKSVRAAWDGNTDAVLDHLPEFEQAMTEYFSAMTAPRFFRVHVAGDFITREYAEAWARIAAAAPGTMFLAFTKQWDNIRGIEFPENFSLVLSGWTGTTIPEDLRTAYPVADCAEKGCDIPAGSFECPGHCYTCGRCWFLKKTGCNVAFHKH